MHIMQMILQGLLKPENPHLGQASVKCNLFQLASGQWSLLNYY